MEIKEIIETEEYKSVVSDYRGMCLWFAADALVYHEGVIGGAWPRVIG